MWCNPGTGRPFTVLAAAVPVQGRVLELGTDNHARKISEIRARLLGRTSVEITWSTGLILSTRKRS